ncbi:MAG TPA: CDP-alcohol phosphatidyltransferase family protein [Gemmatimonadaceae bacterium]|jgi:phosphatidylglycerophosphate synthase
MVPSRAIRAGSRASLRAIPNILSFSRVVLAGAFVMLDDANTRLMLVGIAGVTDVLDGWIARRAKVASKWGALIDPIADRVFALIAVSTFLFNGALSTTGYFVMISRDIMTAIGFLVARAVAWLRPIQFKARMSGKLVTVLQFVTFIALLKFPDFVTPCLWLVGAVSLYSIADYTFALWRARAQ